MQKNLCFFTAVNIFSLKKKKVFENFAQRVLTLKFFRNILLLCIKIIIKAEVIQMDGKSDGIPLEPESYRTYQLNIAVCLGLLHFLS